MDQIEKDSNKQIAREIFDRLTTSPVHYHAGIYDTVEKILETKDDYEIYLEITFEEFSRGKHASYIEWGKYILCKIRAGDEEYVVGLVENIVSNAYSLAEIGLPEIEFKGYAEIVAVLKTRIMAEKTLKSWDEITAIIRIANISAEGGVAKLISESTSKIVEHLIPGQRQ